MDKAIYLMMTGGTIESNLVPLREVNRANGRRDNVEGEVDEKETSPLETGKGLEVFYISYGESETPKAKQESTAKQDSMVEAAKPKKAGKGESSVADSRICTVDDLSENADKQFEGNLFGASRSSQSWNG